MQKGIFPQTLNLHPQSDSVLSTKYTYKVGVVNSPPPPKQKILDETETGMLFTHIMYIHTYIRNYMDTCTHIIYIHTYDTNMYIRTYVIICTYSWVCMHVYTYILRNSQRPCPVLPCCRGEPTQHHWQPADTPVYGNESMSDVKQSLHVRYSWYEWQFVTSSVPVCYECKHYKWVYLYMMACSLLQVYSVPEYSVHYCT